MRTKEGKAIREAWELANPNRTPISADEYSQSMFIADALHANATVRELLRGGHNERSVFARDPETGSGLSEAEIGANVITFIGAGHETTANALTWSLYLLSQAPEIREALEAEVDAALSQQANSTQYHLAHILVGLPEGATAEQIATGQSKIDGIKSVIERGQLNFSAAAVRYSDSPNAL